MIGRKDRRHLGDSVPAEGRRLRSAFDVFDFVNNAVSSGVQDAKSKTDKVLKSLAKQIEPVAEDVQRGVFDEDVKRLVGRGEKVIKEQAKKIDQAVDEVVQKLD